MSERASLRLSAAAYAGGGLILVAILAVALPASLGQALVAYGLIVGAVFWWLPAHRPLR